MKKVIVSVLAIIFAIIAVVMILIFCNQKTEIIMNAYYNQFTVATTLNLGKYKVSDYKYEMFENISDRASFTVESESEFYNSIIKENEYFNSKYDYEVDGYFAFGFLYKDGYFFHYSIKDRKVELITVQCTFAQENENQGNTSEIYYVKIPFLGETSFSRLSSENGYAHMLFNSDISYAMMEDMAEAYGNDYCMVNENEMLFRGIYSYDNHEFSDQYLLRIINNYGTAVIKSYE